jgi:EamA domain-containing membrane protein RarD
MGDRERGAILIALAVGLLVVTAADRETLDSWRARVELGLVALGVVAGLGLILFGRSR